MFLVTRTQHTFPAQFYLTLSHSTKAYSPEHTTKAHTSITNNLDYRNFQLLTLFHQSHHYLAMQRL